MKQRQRLVSEKARQVELKRIMTNPTAEIGKARSDVDRDEHLTEVARREGARKRDKQAQLGTQARGRWKAAGFLAALPGNTKLKQLGGASGDSKTAVQPQPDGSKSASQEVSTSATDKVEAETRPAELISSTPGQTAGESKDAAAAVGELPAPDSEP
eukprot:COSAG02_NODE_1240_length_13709_cov_14.174798_10_plen_157_part_00